MENKKIVEEKKKEERTKEEEKKMVWFKLNGLGSSQNGQNNLIHNWCIGGCWFTQAQMDTQRTRIKNKFCLKSGTGRSLNLNIGDLNWPALVFSCF
jgi:hypothetical protein